MRPLSFDERLTEHRERVLALAHGVNVGPPKEWATLDDRLTHFVGLQSPAMQQLKDAVANGADDADLIELRARALAEIGALPTTVGQLNTDVGAYIYDKMLTAYAKVAKPNYNKVATEFDSAARDFISSANVVDPETPADQLVVADEPIRRAWSDALVHAARLDHMTDMLCHAAELCGIIVGWQAYDGGTLALVTEPGSCTRAELFKAWQTTTGRAGKWAALLKAGAKIRAHPLDDFKPYRPDDDAKPEPPEPFDPIIRRRSGKAVIA